MRKKIPSFITILLFISAFLIVFDMNFELTPIAKGGTIYVPTNYPTIQEAVDAAIPGDTVYVYSGTYYEDVLINKNIDLIGENMNTTIIEGIGSGDVIYVSADFVEISGFTINGGVFVPGEAGIELNNVQNCKIFGNTISINIQLYYSSGNTIFSNTVLNIDYCAIFLYYADGNTISKNIVPGGDFHGIVLINSSNNSIKDNTAYNLSNCGIYLDSSSNNNIILDNNVSNNGVGILLLFSNSNTVSNNVASGNGQGIYLLNTGDNDITNNILTNNWNGIALEYSNGNNILNNNASSGNNYGVYLKYSNLNNITGNNASLNNDCGIYMISSNENDITSNRLLNNKYGIYLDSSRENNFKNNEMIKNGVFINRGVLGSWNTHNIETSNTVNGKPVFYWKNQNGGLVPPGAGQVILANCSYVKIENQELANSSVGIELGFSSNNTIINNTISDNIYGALLYSSENIIFVNCSIANSFSYDFCLQSNSHGTVINSTFNKTRTYFYDTLSTLTVKWYLHVNVTDYSGNPVPNAKVKVEDNVNGMYCETFLTQVDGYVRWIPVTEYVEQKSKKVIYTPHQIIAWKDTLVGYAYPNPFIDESKTVNIVLVNGTLLDLEYGWNLISLPRTQSDTNLQTVLSSVEGRYNAVQWYNASDSDNWKHNHISKPSYMNDLNELNHKIGFWLHIIDPQGTTLVIIGNEPTINQTIILHEGWNLVGYPSLTYFNRTLGLNNLTFNTHVDSIWSYNASIQKWEELGPTDHFEICRGYWIHANQKCLWEVPL